MTVSQTDMVTLPDRAESEGGEKASLSSTDIGRERGRERGREGERQGERRGERRVILTKRIIQSS